MRSVLFFLSVFVLASLFTLFAQPVLASSNVEQSSSPVVDVGLNTSQTHIAVCSAKKPNAFRCHAHIVTDKGLSPFVTQGPSGFSPAQLLKAYKLSAFASRTTTIAIVDAFDAPTVFADLNTYSKNFAIPTLKQCDVATGSVQNPCFQKINQHGSTKLPKVEAGWALETSLDVEMVHALCQNCNILLVEADSDSWPDLLAAFDAAYAKHPAVISNSYGTLEFSGQSNFDSHFKHAGIAITFSSGDSGYGVEYPAASRFVTAVGGTSLKLNRDNTYKSESAWNGAGSGCSKYEAKPVFQKDTGCPKRTVADISAVADPATGVAVYDSTTFQGKKGWVKLGGTSVSSPIIAAAYALSGPIAGATFGNTIPYAKQTSNNLNDITAGNNGTCLIKYLCTAVSGYDGPTGLGTPIGIGAL